MVKGGAFFQKGCYIVSWWFFEVSTRNEFVIRDNGELETEQAVRSGAYVDPVRSDIVGDPCKVVRKGLKWREDGCH